MAVNRKRNKSSHNLPASNANMNHVDGRTRLPVFAFPPLTFAQRPHNYPFQRLHTCICRQRHKMQSEVSQFPAKHSATKPVTDLPTFHVAQLSSNKDRSLIQTLPSCMYTTSQMCALFRRHFRLSNRSTNKHILR
jgi:hypothetical protein